MQKIEQSKCHHRISKEPLNFSGTGCMWLAKNLPTLCLDFLFSTFGCNSSHEDRQASSSAVELGTILAAATLEITPSKKSIEQLMSSFENPP